MEVNIIAFIASSTPLLFATLGALVSERAGVLAVCMDGAINIAGFLAIAFTIYTGDPVMGFIIACAITMATLALLALFSEKTGANPFLVGLSVNLFSAGLTSWLSSSLFGTRGVIALSEFSRQIILPHHVSIWGAWICVGIVYFFFYYTPQGMRLRVSASAAEALRARGFSLQVYRIIAWTVASFFASCAGGVIAFSLGAYVPNLSAGKGWTALAVVFLGRRSILPSIAAVFLFTLAEYLTNTLQGGLGLPSTVILGLPYAIAFIVLVLSSPKVRH